MCVLFLLSAWCVLPSTAHTDVVFFLCHLWRDTNTDLVKPLIAAAITLDPVHLVTKSREMGCSEEKCHSQLGRPASRYSGHCPRTGASGTTANHRSVAVPPPKPPREEAESLFRLCLLWGRPCCPVTVSKRALHQHPSHLLIAGTVRAGGAREGKVGRTRVSSGKGGDPGRC